jgi:hypothetical protein
MKRALALIFVLELGCHGNESVRTEEAPRFPVTIAAEHITVLTDAPGRELLKQCSRETPSGITAIWSATQADLAKVDSLLPRLVEMKLAAAITEGSPIDQAHSRGNTDYYAQIVGVQRGSERLLYVNGIHASMFKDHSDSTGWRRHAIYVCDGGEGYFGVLFNPATGRFSDFHFNGPS